MQPGWSPGRGCGLREQGAPRNLRGDLPAHGKDSHLSPKPVTSVGAPDSWRPKSLSRPLLCWGRVSGDTGAPSSPIAQLCFSSWLSLPHFGASWRPSPSGVLAAPLDRGVGGESSEGAAQSPPFSGLVQGRKGGVLASSHNFRTPRPQPTFVGGPAAPAPRPTPDARLPRGSHKAHGSPAAESHRWPAPGPCAQPRSPSRSRSPPAPQQRVAAAVQASHQSFSRRRWGARRAGSSAPPRSPRRDWVRGTVSGRVRPGAAVTGTQSSSLLFELGSDII